MSAPPRRLSDQVTTLLRSRIYSGEYKPNQRLLELDLCAELTLDFVWLRPGRDDFVTSREGAGRIEEARHLAGRHDQARQRGGGRLAEARGVDKRQHIIRQRYMRDRGPCR